MGRMSEVGKGVDDAGSGQAEEALVERHFPQERNEVRQIADQSGPQDDGIGRGVSGGDAEREDAVGQVDRRLLDRSHRRLGRSRRRRREG